MAQKVSEYPDSQVTRPEKAHLLKSPVYNVHHRLPRASDDNMGIQYPKPVLLDSHTKWCLGRCVIERSRAGGLVVTNNVAFSETHLPADNLSVEDLGLIDRTMRSDHDAPQLAREQEVKEMEEPERGRYTPRAAFDVERVPCPPAGNELQLVLRSTSTSSSSPHYPTPNDALANEEQAARRVIGISDSSMQAVEAAGVRSDKK